MKGIRPHYYLNLPFITHPPCEDAAQRPTRPQGGLWWLIMALALLAIFLIGVPLLGGM